MSSMMRCAVRLSSRLCTYRDVAPQLDVLTAATAFYTSSHELRMQCTASFVHQHLSFSCVLLQGKTLMNRLTGALMAKACCEVLSSAPKWKHNQLLHIIKQEKDGVSRQLPACASMLPATSSTVACNPGDCRFCSCYQCC